MHSDGGGGQGWLDCSCGCCGCVIFVSLTLLVVVCVFRGDGWLLQYWRTPRVLICVFGGAAGLHDLLVPNLRQLVKKGAVGAACRLGACPCEISRQYRSCPYACPVSLRPYA